MSNTLNKVFFNTFSVSSQKHILWHFCKIILMRPCIFNGGRNTHMFMRVAKCFIVHLHKRFWWRSFQIENIPVDLKSSDEIIPPFIAKSRRVCLYTIQIENKENLHEISLFCKEMENILKQIAPSFSFSCFNIPLNKKALWWYFLLLDPIIFFLKFLNS